VIERGSTPDQRVTVATLATIAERAAARGVQNPAVIVVGQVAALGDG
jgi:uroporphyrin-III C-methyltransferase/precorrin-2 dehydrogenase/sirohydrochlorin ferrochelatase